MKTEVDVGKPMNGKDNYCGTVTEDGNSLLKMYKEKKFKKPSSEPHLGSDFTLFVDMGKDIFTGSDFEVTEGKNAVEIINSDSKNASVKLKTKEMGNFKINAELKADSADELYWGYRASYSGNISKQKGEISFVENPSKVYDGEKVIDPKVTDGIMIARAARKNP